MESNYCYPTTKHPVFTVYCTAFGYIETGMYKNWNVKKEGIINMVGDTFACNYKDAIRMLHEWIEEEGEYVKGLKGDNKFVIDVIDGSLDKYGDVKHTAVYTISAAKAKKYLL